MTYRSLKNWDIFFVTFPIVMCHMWSFNFRVLRSLSLIYTSWQHLTLIHMVLPSSLPTIFLLCLMLPSFSHHIYFVFFESVSGIQCRRSLFIVCVSLNVNICSIWSSQCLENVWTPLRCFVMYVEHLQWKLKDRLTPRIKKGYKLYFGCKFGDEDKLWVRHICWVTCASKLSGYRVHDNRCHFQYRWTDVSKMITSETVISDWPIWNASLPNPNMLFCSALIII